MRLAGTLLMAAALGSAAQLPEDNYLLINRAGIEAVREGSAVIREARAHTELKGSITGELNQQANPGGGIIFLPVVVPVGAVSPLNVQLDSAAMRQARAEREKEMGVIEAQVVPNALPPAAPGPRAALPAPASAPAPGSGPPSPRR